MVRTTRALAKLVRNFAHETLLELPNELFYEGDLLCCGDPMLIRAARTGRACRRQRCRCSLTG